MKPIFLALTLVLLLAPSGWTQSVDTPMDFVKKFEGDQHLNFDAAGQSFSPKGTRLRYREISSEAQWKRVWGYLYDSTVKVDFKKYHVLAIYKSPADGNFNLVPKRVLNFQGKMNVTVLAVWNGKTTKSYPFLFLVVNPFKKLEVTEDFAGPTGKPQRFP